MYERTPFTAGRLTPHRVLVLSVFVPPGTQTPPFMYNPISHRIQRILNRSCREHTGEISELCVCEFCGVRVMQQDRDSCKLTLTRFQRTVGFSLRVNAASKSEPASGTRRSARRFARRPNRPQDRRTTGDRHRRPTSTRSSRRSRVLQKKKPGFADWGTDVSAHGPLKEKLDRVISFARTRT